MCAVHATALSKMIADYNIHAHTHMSAIASYIACTFCQLRVIYVWEHANYWHHRVQAQVSADLRMLQTRPALCG